MKKLVSLFLALMLAFGMFSISGITVSAASNMTLQQLQAKFPHGAYWNHMGMSSNNADGYTYTPCPSHQYSSSVSTCNSFDGCWQCYGFARKLGYDAFGTYPSSWSRVTNLNSLKPGDIVRYMYGGHAIFVTGVNGDTVTYADCNYGWTCIIRWNQTTTKSAIAGNGFDYVESAPSTLSVSTISPSVSIDTGYWRYSIGETNAVVCANINNPNGGTIGTIGCYLYDANGEYIYCHSEEVNPSYKNATTVPMWTDFNVDAGYTLKMGTTYQYRLYAYIDGVEYCSEIGAFTTGGRTETPPKNAVLMVEKETIHLGEKIVAYFSADNAEKYTVYIGSESFDTTSKTFEYQPTVSGTYKVYMVAKNQDGSVTSNTITVNVETNQPKENIVVSVGRVAQIPGEIVRVPVSFEATYGVLACDIVLEFDSEKLQLIDVEDGDLHGLCLHNQVGNQIKFSAATTLPVKQGDFFTLCFYVNNDTPAGLSEVKFIEATFAGEKEIPWDIRTNNGGVIVRLGSGLGDVNVDTKINAKDALEVLKATVGKVNLTQEQQTAADVNKDGKVDAKDALEILKYTVGKPSALDNQ